MSCFTTSSIKSSVKPTWCPGCGDFMILNSIQKAVSDLELPDQDVVFLYGIGCSGNMADFNKSYGFHGLHGRSIANAIGMKLSNHKLKIIVIGGDGDLYGEGLNHFIAAARGNHDITMIVHNNERYSLTTGQSSPTAETGTKTKSTPQGVVESQFNPLMMALAANASFVSRGYSTKPQQLTQLIKNAISHPGFSLVDTLQLCPTFNKQHNHPWFAERIYDLSENGHDSSDKAAAINKSQEENRFGLGILYQNKNSIAYHQQLEQLKSKSLLEQRSNKKAITISMSDFV